MNTFEHVDTAVGKKQGNIGVARAVYEYTKLGYTVLAPLSDSDKYDLVVDNGQQLRKVQVKTSRCRKPGQTAFQVQLSTSGGNRKINTFCQRKQTDYDLLFVLVEDGRCWSIPATEFVGGSTINVGALGQGARYTEFEIK
jgi:hypothetical protein